MENGTTMQASPEIITGTLRMVRDKLLVRPLDWDASSVIVALRSGRPVRGIVVSAGPGTYPNKYSRDRSKCWPSKVFVKTQVQPGDTVELGGLNAYDGRGYIWSEVIVGGIKHIICSEQDVAGIRTDVPHGTNS